MAFTNGKPNIPPLLKELIDHQHKLDDALLANPVDFHKAVELIDLKNKLVAAAAKQYGYQLRGDGNAGTA